MSGVDEPAGSDDATTLLSGVVEPAGAVFNGLLEVGPGDSGGTLSTVVAAPSSGSVVATVDSTSVESGPGGGSSTSGSDVTGSSSTPSGPIVHRPTSAPVASKTGAASGTASARDVLAAAADVEFLAEGDDRPVAARDAGERCGVFDGRRGKLDHGDAIAGADQFRGRLPTLTEASLRSPPTDPRRLPRW